MSFPFAESFRKLIGALSAVQLLVIASINLLVFVSFSCDKRTESSLNQSKRIEAYMNFSDRSSKDHFIAEFIKLKERDEALKIEIRDSKDSLLFVNTWSLRNWVSVANKVNYILTEEERSQRLALIFDQSLAPGKFGLISGFLVTRIVDDSDDILKAELDSTSWRPVYSLFFSDAILVYSPSLNRVVEINAVERSLLEKYSIPF